MHAWRKFNRENLSKRQKPWDPDVFQRLFFTFVWHGPGRLRLQLAYQSGGASPDAFGFRHS